MFESNSHRREIATDIFVDTNKAHEIYQRWLKTTRPAPGPDNLRRPLWLLRAYKPDIEAYYMTGENPLS